MPGCCTSDPDACCTFVCMHLWLCPQGHCHLRRVTKQPSPDKAALSLCAAHDTFKQHLHVLLRTPRMITRTSWLRKSEHASGSQGVNAHACSPHTHTHTVCTPGKPKQCPGQYPAHSHAPQLDHHLGRCLLPRTQPHHGINTSPSSWHQHQPILMASALPTPRASLDGARPLRLSRCCQPTRACDTPTSASTYPCIYAICEWGVRHGQT